MEAFHAAQVAFMLTDTVKVVRCNVDEPGTSQAAYRVRLEASACDRAQVLIELTPPPPARTALTGPRSASFALEDPMEIVVLIDDHDRFRLEPRLAEIAAAASEAEPSVRPSISIVSSQQWDHQQASERPTAHYNIWLAPGAAP